MTIRGARRTATPPPTRVQLTVSAAWMRLIDQAASLEGRTRANFMALAAMRAAQACLDAAPAGTTPTPIEQWNAAAACTAAAYDLPQVWILISPVECQALADGVVGTRVQGVCAGLHREPLSPVVEGSV